MSILKILVRQLDLMARNRFEAISAFFHVVTIQEEKQNKEDPLKKVGSMYDTTYTYTIPLLLHALLYILQSGNIYMDKCMKHNFIIQKYSVNCMFCQYNGSFW